ncbi:MAG: hypothetical protein Fur009_6920 [Candidatus Microgenomates bacterium]
MKTQIAVFDSTASDSQSKVRGVGRYLKILKENFPQWTFSSNIKHLTSNVFINPFFNFLQPPLTLKRLAKKQIAVIHDLIPLKYPHHFPAGIRGNFNIFLNKLALKNYDLIITDSFASKKDIVQILNWPEDKIKVIYPCLSKTFINQKNNNLTIKQFNNLNYCLYVGDATWNKNLVNLVQAIKIANVSCVFVGKIFEKNFINEINNPWNKELKQFLKETKNDKRFVFKGFVNDDELAFLYKNASVNLLLSRDEGFGFSYLEAANFKTPSIISDIPVLNEISNNQGVLKADPENPNDIADKIIEIYFDKKKREKLGQQAFLRSQFFSSKKFKSQFLNIALK